MIGYDSHPKLVYLGIALRSVRHAHWQFVSFTNQRPRATFSRMSTVQEIEAAIPKLPPTDLAELRAWFDDYFKKVSSEIEKDCNERLKAACESANRDTQLKCEIEEWQSFDDSMPVEAELPLAAA